MTYTLISDTDADGVIRDADGAFIPSDQNNRDWIEYQEWRAGGSTPTLKPVPVSTEVDYSAAIQTHVDDVARQKSYSDGVSCASYVESTNAQWRQEAISFIAWRDQVWNYVYVELAKVQAGTRTQPTIQNFVIELPTISWPVASSS